MVDSQRWLGAVEGYYGELLAPEKRLALVEWLGGQGYNCYGYAPKHDPFHRDRWREPYPADSMAHFAELVDTGRSSGAEVALALSPGLDWRDGDEANLVPKLAAFRELGASILAVAFDDVPPGGADLGAAHGRAVAAAIDAIGGAADGVRWFTCPTDYATPIVTPYLRAFADELPDEVGIMWTGPSIVSPRVRAADAASFGAALGRKPIFAENFPVNDGGMEGVLHIGPYPDREPGLAAETVGVICNFMRHPLASRIGLAVAARFWLDPASDREQAWRDVIATNPGLEPLALASRSWVGAPEPAPELLEWAAAAVTSHGADTRLLTFLQAGCRADLDPALAAEVAPWLEQWDRQSHAMQFAYALLAHHPARPPEQAFAVQALWRRARERSEEVFGVRWAGYPVTTFVDAMDALPEGIVRGDNLADRLCAAALGL
jgi:hyaluronoglucosaminidase